MRGNIILTDLPTVASPGFWVAHPNVAVTVNCIGQRHGAHRVTYPEESANSLKVYVDVRSVANLPIQFAKAAPRVEKTLENGMDVVMHCRESYHRAPGIVVAMLVRLRGVDYKVDM